MGKTNYGKTVTAPVKFSVARGKEFWRQKTKWFSLAYFELSENDRAYALDKALALTTGKKAIAFVNKMHAKAAEVHVVGDSWEPISGFWSYSVLDKLGDCVVVKYRGVAIRLLYKRTIMEHPITELEPVPDKPTVDEDDAWIYLDLVSGSARQMHEPTLKRMEELEREVAALRKRIASQDDLIIENERSSYAKAVADMRSENSATEALLMKVADKQQKALCASSKAHVRLAEVKDELEMLKLNAAAILDPEDLEAVLNGRPKKATRKVVDMSKCDAVNTIEMDVCAECGRKPPGHHLLCKTGNDKARRYQDSLRQKGGKREAKARKGKAKGRAADRKDTGKRRRKAV